MSKPFFSRQSHRKHNYDYALPGCYFVTVVVHNNAMLLGKCSHGTIVLSAAGQIVEQSWNLLTTQSAFVTSDAFVIMPNHVHGIIRIHGDTLSRSLGELIRTFKAKSSKLIRETSQDNFAWQRNYYDRIIRTERELRLTQLYIATNPLLWKIDPENTERSVDDVSGNLSIFKQCGFSEEDVEMIKNYVEYRRAR